MFLIKNGKRKEISKFKYSHWSVSFADGGSSTFVCPSPYFASGGFASFGGNAARPIFNAVAVCVKCEPWCSANCNSSWDGCREPSAPAKVPNDIFK